MLFSLFLLKHFFLVTYREVDLLIDPLKASNSQKQRVCTVVTHELAHQVGIPFVVCYWSCAIFAVSLFTLTLNV